MQAFTVVQGPAAPLMQPNIDTDVIVRIERLTSVARNELGGYALEALRYRADGSEEPGFVLNQPSFREAPILLTGRNFGCGSSREGAVWALAARGVRCVIGESFGDIFHSNCFENGLLPIRLSGDQIVRIAGLTSDGQALTVDLIRQVLALPDGSQLSFEVDQLRRTALLEGLDSIGRTLKHDAEIAAWQVNDRVVRPWIWQSLRTGT